MCGIAGIIGFDIGPEARIAATGRMTEIQRHRGPDDGDVHAVSQDSNVVFGHRRLAIVDLSEAGRQPMVDGRSGNVIVFNGEIYNFKELRADLESAGDEFRTRTDTEVILKAYARWGVAAFSKLRGMFAFALWDSASRRTLLVRDPVGVKPLYYVKSDRGAAFASEVRALLASGRIDRKLDVRGLHSYLAYGSVQEPYTLISDVESVPPGAVLTIELGQAGGVQRSIQKYWVLGTRGPGSEGAHSLRGEIRGLLTRAVTSQMVADVPVGSFLSGGIDSTAITALMQSATARRVHTVCVAFDESKYDERSFAKLAASRIGTDHTELILSGAEVSRSLPAALTAFDQPSVDGLNTYFVSQATRRAGMTVALSGVGGDELFAGYDAYHRARLAISAGRALKVIPAMVRSAIGNGMRFAEMLGGGERFRRARSLALSSTEPYFLSRQYFSDGQVQDLLAEQVASRARAWWPDRFAELSRQTHAWDDINRISALELQTYMLSTLLRDTDQMSMAHSLEIRVPFLDLDLVEYMLNVPGTAKVADGRQKPLLADAVSDLIPPECLNRPKKGFELPFEVWLRDALRDRMAETFTLPPIDGVFDRGGLGGMWASFNQGRLGWTRVWALFVLLDWIGRNRVHV